MAILMKEPASLPTLKSASASTVVVVWLLAPAVGEAVGRMLPKTCTLPVELMMESAEGEEVAVPATVEVAKRRLPPTFLNIH